MRSERVSSDFHVSQHEVVLSKIYSGNVSSQVFYADLKMHRFVLHQGFFDHLQFRYSI